MSRATLRTLAATLAASSAYGFAIGWAHDWIYAARNVVKFPLLIVTTASLGSVSFWLVASSFRVDLGFAAAQRLAWTLFHDASMLLASLAPPVFFVASTLQAGDDGVLGRYDEFLAANMLLIATCGALALVRQAKALLAENLARSRAIAVTLAWLAISLVVGGQASFWMRPFFGFPATRGARPPFFLRDAPDLRGATNFFEAVLQTISRPGFRASSFRASR